MTTAVATIALTYDGTDLQESDLGIFLEITQGLNDVPEVRGQDVTIPGSDGQVARNRRLHQMKLVLTGHVMGNGASTAAARSDFRSQVRTLRTLFSPSRQPADLVATLEDSDTATIAARPLNMIWNEIIPSEFARVSIELLSVSPDWDFT